jgi:hypothetical protein
MSMETTKSMAGASDLLVLDRSRLAELSGNEDDFERQLLEVFLISATGDVARLSSAVETSDPAALVRTAHGLKGASQQIGADGLAEFAKRLEYEGRTAAPAQLAEMLVAVEAELERVRRAAAPLIGNRTLAFAV